MDKIDVANEYMRRAAEAVELYNYEKAMALTAMANVIVLDSIAAHLDNLAGQAYNLNLYMSRLD